MSGPRINTSRNLKSKKNRNVFLVLSSKLIYNNSLCGTNESLGETPISHHGLSKKNNSPYDSKTNIPIITRNQPQETANTFEDNRRANIEIFTINSWILSLTNLLATNMLHRLTLYQTSQLSGIGWKTRQEPIRIQTLTQRDSNLG